MLGWFGFAMMGIFLPTVLVAMFAALMLFLLALASRKPFDWRRLLVATGAALGLELVFLLVAGALIGLVLGRSIGYGFPILMVLTTFIVGIIGFVYFLARGIPPAWLAHRRVRAVSKIAAEAIAKASARRG